ncbi:MULTISPECIES: acyl-CoA thioesterase [Actinopolyspora]|uniref:Acyl-CoA thioester hydrolase n=1 Tax=Actinopolyspora saharensis TaxID=995062 RepID=A0A1H1DN72_9ACTN|nr:thioesterase family protein [Actinopolyspora saharensis]NHD18411.1 acyl-CoA thioesterase [Actinopolyspora sp. BKK2]NHE77630.1 acyl-CoA thioesterase [Actinopolyspora sp. BKK1]SDQ77316.1 acyl-CoA thioester hydrolase [Actinopolyspora saharensis]
MGAFVTEVPIRWSDMDAFGHVNHARTVTLLEEARAGLLFTEAERRGHGGMADGMVVARLTVDYRSPVDYRMGHVQVRMSVRELRRASFVVDYAVAAGGTDSVATAETLMVPYDLTAGRPRRLTEGEFSFLEEWVLDPVIADEEPRIA